MAIYTNYGRYLKAKMFKQILSETGETYMLFGIGNHLWDNEDTIPIAPYNTEIITDEVASNQFIDTHVNQYFLRCPFSDGAPSSSPSTDQIISDGVLGESAACDLANAANIHLPPFPCIWQHYVDNSDASIDDVLIGAEDGAPSGVSITRNNYHKYFIISRGDVFDWYTTSSSTPIGTTSTAIINGTAAQYFAELNIRGNALKHNADFLKDTVQSNVPCGLLGAVKCSIDFVKDIGVEGNTTYSGRSNQFFYGDRYWEIISPDEVLNKDGEALPSHLIITSTVNPRNLNEVLKIDQNIVPRQIAIYFREKRRDSSDNPIEGDVCYKVHQNLFNFGQYKTSDFKEDLTGVTGDILSFNPAYSVEDEETHVVTQYEAGEFKFILTDYIKGSVRADRHAIDRFGYVIGF